jgi:hypothetical protein
MRTLEDMMTAMDTHAPASRFYVCVPHVMMHDHVVMSCVFQSVQFCHTYKLEYVTNT